MPYYDTVTKVWEVNKWIPTTGWTVLSYNGTTNAESRKYIGVFNRSPYKLFITTDNTVDAKSTRAIKKGGERIFPYSDKVTLYGRSAGTGSVRVVITEECG